MSAQVAMPGGSHGTGDVVLALDVGTSSTRCLAFDPAGRQIAGIGTTREYQARVTSDGGLELDADAVLEHGVACLAGAAEAVLRGGGRVLAVGVCTFWHALLGLDDAGRPATPIYLWNDSRAAEQTLQLRGRLDETAVHRRTGCVLHPSYLPARLLWLKETDPQRYRRCKAFVSPGEYLERRLFGAERCGLSMASGTGLLNQHTLRWDEEILAAIGVAPERLSPLEPAHAPVCGVRGGEARLAALRDVPFFPPLGDGACSNVGSGATGETHAALTIGTSAALRVLFRQDAPLPPAGLWRYLLDGRRALIGGALSNGGNLYAWMRETLRLGPEADVEAWLAQAEPGAHGLTVLPFLAGERNPDFPLNATGAIAGLRAATTPREILQAGLEAVAFRLAAIAGRLRVAQPGLRGFLASGGLLRSPAWLRMVTDVLGLPVTLSAVQEASARGAALMALEGIGRLPSALDADLEPGRTLTPHPRRQEAYARARERHERFYAHWRSADPALRG
jgi:gluconokinase